MDSSKRECAPEDTQESWSKVDWRSCEESVRRLQARIVKATQERRFNKVKSLQRILVNSFAAKALAVKQVTENKGKRTAGVDGILWSTPQLKFKSIQALTKYGYKASPLKRVYIPKANGKQRPLGIPTMKDRAMQALYLMALEPIAETTADHDSYGFRKYRSTHDAIQQCHVSLSMKTSGQWIFEADIKGCFDQINHEWLMQHIPMDKTILQQWLKSGFVFKKKKRNLSNGVRNTARRRNLTNADEYDVGRIREAY